MLYHLSWVDPSRGVVAGATLAAESPERAADVVHNSDPYVDVVVVELVDSHLDHKEHRVVVSFDGGLLNRRA